MANKTGTAVICAALGVCGTAWATPPPDAPQPDFHTGPPTAEDIRQDQERQQLDRDYEQSKQDCAKIGLVTLVANQTPDGRHLRFDCVGADNPEYKAQHQGEVDLPAQRGTDLDSRLRPLVGKPISYAIALLGATGSRFVGNSLVYMWECDKWTTLRGTILTNEALTESCKIRLTTDRTTHVIQSYDWSEKRGACGAFATALDKAPAD